MDETVAPAFRRLQISVALGVAALLGNPIVRVGGAPSGPAFGALSDEPRYPPLRTEPIKKRPKSARIARKQAQRRARKITRQARHG